MKKWIIALAIAGMLIVGTVSVAFAAELFDPPAQTVADLTGRTVDEVLQARQNGAPYGTLAAEAGKLDEFKEERLEQYWLALQEAVAQGRLTQEEADELYKNREQRMENCNGDGSGRMSGGLGLGRRNGRGGGQGGGQCGLGSCIYAE